MKVKRKECIKFYIFFSPRESSIYFDNNLCLYVYMKQYLPQYQTRIGNN